jgi:hypothetical protein
VGQLTHFTLFLLQTYVSTLVLKLQLLSSELNHSLREFSAKSLRNIPK